MYLLLTWWVRQLLNYHCRYKRTFDILFLTVVVKWRRIWTLNISIKNWLYNFSTNFFIKPNSLIHLKAVRTLRFFHQLNHTQQEVSISPSYNTNNNKVSVPIDLQQTNRRSHVYFFNTYTDRQTDRQTTLIKQFLPMKWFEDLWGTNTTLWTPSSWDTASTLLVS